MVFRIKINNISLLTIFLLFWCIELYSERFLDFKSGPVSFQYATFLLPNENEPELALPIWKQSSNGIYLSVGSDRSFLGAAQSNADYLLALDRDPGIVAYNRMMIEMLKIANDGPDLRRMRTDMDYLRKKFDDAKISGKNMDFDFIAETLEKPQWELLINRSFVVGGKVHWMWRDDDARAHVIYWKDPKLFHKMQTMAREDRIQAELVDLKDLSLLAKLESSIKKAGLKIAVLDFSNTQKRAYLGPNGIDDVFKTLREVMHADTILLFTSFSYDVTDVLTEAEYASFLVKNYDIAIFSNRFEFQNRLLLMVDSKV